MSQYHDFTDVGEAADALHAEWFGRVGRHDPWKPLPLADAMEWLRVMRDAPEHCIDGAQVARRDAKGGE